MILRHYSTVICSEHILMIIDPIFMMVPLIYCFVVLLFLTLPTIFAQPL